MTDTKYPHDMSEAMKPLELHDRGDGVKVSGPVMTGAEWLEQFEKQTKGRIWGCRNDEERELIQDICLYYERAARRASGLV